jgi:hypothetical protein
LRIVVARVATWTRSPGGAAGAGVLTLPWFIGVAFTNPAAVFAEGALHRDRVDKMHQRKPRCGRPVPDIKS